jgi:hypothetical protein
MSHLLRLYVPKYHVRLRLVRPRVRVDDRVRKVGPLVVGADVGKVDEGVDGEGDAQTTTLPRAG